MQNVRFRYLYRDGNNFKSWADVVFRDPDHGDLRGTKKLLECAFKPDGLFIAGQIRVPEVFLYSRCRAFAEDHCFHEFYSLERTPDHPNDRFDRSIGQFVAAVQREANRGWVVFDPFDRCVLQR
jgi:hypothetical protein